MNIRRLIGGFISRSSKPPSYRTRRKLLASARALASEGVTPPGVDTPKAYHQRSGGIVLPRGADWWDATAHLREQFDATPEPVKAQ